MTAAPAIGPVAASSGESPDQPTERKFWERTKLRLMHLLPATTGSVMLWVPSAAIILVVAFLGVLRLTELWAPQAQPASVDQSTVLAAPPSAPAPYTDEPAATESTSPSDPGSPSDPPPSHYMAPRTCYKAASRRWLQTQTRCPRSTLRLNFKGALSFNKTLSVKFAGQQRLHPHALSRRAACSDSVVFRRQSRGRAAQLNSGRACCRRAKAGPRRARCQSTGRRAAVRLAQRPPCAAPVRSLIFAS